MVSGRCRTGDPPGRELASRPPAARRCWNGAASGMLAGALEAMDTDQCVLGRNPSRGNGLDGLLAPRALRSVRTARIRVLTSTAQDVHRGIELVGQDSDRTHILRSVGDSVLQRSDDQTEGYHLQRFRALTGNETWGDHQVPRLPQCKSDKRVGRSLLSHAIPKRVALPQLTKCWRRTQ